MAVAYEEALKSIKREQLIGPQRGISIKATDLRTRVNDFCNTKYTDEYRFNYHLDMSARGKFGKVREEAFQNAVFTVFGMEFHQGETSHTGLVLSSYALKVHANWLLPPSLPPPSLPRRCRARRVHCCCCRTVRRGVTPQ